MEIALVLGLLVAAVVLFALEVLSIDLVTLMLLAILILVGILTPAEAFAGFGSEIIIILGSIFVMSGALQVTGILNRLGEVLHRAGGSHRVTLTAVLMSLTSGVSAFMNNTTVTAMFLMPVMAMARRLKISPSKFLIPLAYASILGGTCTLIGTSTNVAVSGYVTKIGMEPIGMFEITGIGLIFVIVGTLYMVLIGQWLLPDHKVERLDEEYALREFLSEIVVAPESPLSGKRIFESELSRMDFNILKVIRGGATLIPQADTRIIAGDILLVKGNVEQLLKAKDARGMNIRPSLKLSDIEAKGDEVKIAEALLTSTSTLEGRTLREANFRRRFGLNVLAMYRHGHPLRDRIADTRLRFGDMFLVQGPTDRLRALRRHRDLWILEQLSPSTASSRKGLITLGLFIAAVLVSGIGLIPVSVAFLCAALLTLLSRVITVEEAYEYLDWQLLILIGGMMAFGTAMTNTGADEFLANGIVRLLEPVGVMGILAGFFVLTSLLSVPMSNAAAALVILPVALQTAHQLDVNPRTLAIAIMLAASLSFIGPFEPACILVYGPGKYRFRDFIKAGVGLTLVLLAVAVFLVPVFWPL
jgi:di/tricarboxylate transporter